MGLVGQVGGVQGREVARGAGGSVAKCTQAHDCTGKTVAHSYSLK